MNRLNISAVVCTLNNEFTISDCLRDIKRNRPKELIVIDGGSEDRTVEFAKKAGAKVINSERGVARQRQVAVELVKCPYIAFIDADDFLEKDCLKKLLRELNENNYDVIQAMTLSHKAKTYWQKAMHYNLKYFISKPGKTNMVGRPALYKMSAFKKVKFDPRFTFNGEDSDMSIQMEEKNLSQGIGTGVSHRYHLKIETLGQCIRKWTWYGQGDAMLVFKYKYKFRNLIYHLLINYPFKKSLFIIKKRKGRYFLFFVLQGWIRFLAFTGEYLRLIILSTLNLRAE